MAPITPLKTSFMLLALFPVTALSSHARTLANSNDALPQSREVLARDVKQNYNPYNIYRPASYKGDPERKTTFVTSTSKSTSLTSVMISSSTTTQVAKGIPDRKTGDPTYAVSSTSTFFSTSVVVSSSASTQSPISTSRLEPFGGSSNLGVPSIFRTEASSSSELRMSTASSSSGLSLSSTSARSTNPTADAERRSRSSTSGMPSISRVSPFSISTLPLVSTSVSTSLASNQIIPQGSSTARPASRSIEPPSGTFTMVSASSLSRTSGVSSSTRNPRPTSVANSNPDRPSSSSLSTISTSSPSSGILSTTTTALSTMSTSSSISSLPPDDIGDQITSISASSTSVMVLPPISRASETTTLSSTPEVSSISERDSAPTSSSSSVFTLSSTSTADALPIPVTSTSDPVTSIYLTIVSDSTTPVTSTLDTTSSTSTTPSPNPDNSDNSSQRPQGSGYDDDTDFMNQMLSAHNFFRAEHNAPPIVWNSDLARSAQNWVENCQFAHAPGDEDYGENLAQGYPNVAASVNGWGLERLNYDYDNPGFSPATGHFTQVVWKETGTVGCGRKDCATGVGGWLVDCLYNEPGNWDGEYQANVGRQTSGDPAVGAPE